MASEFVIIDVRGGSPAPPIEATRAVSEAIGSSVYETGQLLRRPGLHAKPAPRSSWASIAAHAVDGITWRFATATDAPPTTERLSGIDASDSEVRFLDMSGNAVLVAGPSDHILLVVGEPEVESTGVRSVCTEDPTRGAAALGMGDRPFVAVVVEGKPVVGAIQPTGPFDWPGEGHTTSRDGRLALLDALHAVASQVTVDTRWRLSTVGPLQLAKPTRGESPLLDDFLAHPLAWAFAYSTPQPELGTLGAVSGEAPADPSPTGRPPPQPRSAYHSGPRAPNLLREEAKTSTSALIPITLCTGLLVGGAWGMLMVTLEAEIGYMALIAGGLVGGGAYFAGGAQVPAVARVVAVAGTLIAIVLSRVILVLNGFDATPGLLDIVFMALAFATAWNMSVFGKSEL